MARRVKKTKFSFVHNRKAILGLVLILLLGTGLVFAKIHNSSPGTPSPPAVTPEKKPQVNLSPPTATEKSETEAHKDALVQQSATPSPTPVDSNAKKQVATVITSATKTEVRAYVSGVAEDGGTCTATATQGSGTRTATSSSFLDAGKTDCTPITFSPSLGTGHWSVSVTYSSATSDGKSTQTWELD